MKLTTCTGHWENLPTAPPVNFRYTGKGIYAQFASFHYGWSPLFTSRRFTTMPLFYRGYIGTAGRLISINMAYGFLGLITSQSTHNPHISLVA